MGIITIFYSYKIQKYLDELNISKLFWVPFLLCNFLILMDVATDAWSLNLVDKAYYGYARSMKLIG